jgi:hypothetical protein
MDPITLIVTALVAGAAAGAAAGLKDTAGQAVKDAYAGLKDLIARKYAPATASLAQLEAQPGSKARRAVLEEDLGKLAAGDDAELLEQAQALLKAVRGHAPDTAGIIGVDLDGVIAAGDIIIRDIHVTQVTNVYTAARPAPPPPFQAPPPTADHVMRSEELKRIRERLLDPADPPTGSQARLLPTTVGLHGFGGSGKTTLAGLFCADERVRAACPGGILWVGLGKNPPDPKATITDLVAALTGECNGCDTLPGSQNQLRAALAGRAVLLVVDDVWRADHAAALLEASAGCARLITTRNAFLLPADAARIELSTMRPEDARAQLAVGLPPGNDARLDLLAQRLGYWPVLLGLANRNVRFRIDGGAKPAAALDAAASDLARLGVVAFDVKDAGEKRDLAVGVTVEASLKLLPPDQRRRYTELAIFPQDVPIPLVAAAQLWGLAAGLSYDASADLVARLEPLALLEYDRGAASLRLHDVLRSYLYGTLNDKADLHGRLAAEWTDRPDAGDQYAWRWLAYHRSAAAAHSVPPQRHELAARLVSLVQDPGWQDAHEAALEDLPSLQDALEEALAAAVADDDPLGLPLLVAAADALVEFRREHGRAEPIFELARAGNLDAARRRSEVIAIDDHWRAALLLMVAWLAPQAAGDEARKLCDEVAATVGADPDLTNLLSWVRTAAWAAQPPPAFPYPVKPAAADAKLIEELVKRVGGWKYDRSFIHSRGLDPDVQDPDANVPHDQPGSGPEQGLEQGLYRGAAAGAGTERKTTRYLAELDGPYLVTYAAVDPAAGMDALERYMSVYGNYSYPEYRYSSLWLLLGFISQYPRRDVTEWVQQAAERILCAALGGPSLEFEQGLPVAVAALRAAAGDAAARQGLQDLAHQLIGEAMHLKPGRDREGSDRWAQHKRMMLAVAQALGWLLRDDGLATQVAAQLLDEALGLADSGFAGFQAPACLALAEAVRVCQPKNQPSVDKALGWAQSAAHNVQDPSFCARMTARVNAMRRYWWPGFSVRERYRRLPDAAWLPEFAALHKVGHKYEGRRPDALDLPDWAESPETFADLAKLYQRPLDDLLRLNGGDKPFTAGAEIAIPDPGFIPHVAARLAAELLARGDPTVQPPEALAWLRGLVPYAVLSPTALDAVLARLVLAQGRWRPPHDPGLADALALVLARRKPMPNQPPLGELLAGRQP